MTQDPFRSKSFYLFIYPSFCTSIHPPSPSQVLILDPVAAEPPGLSRNPLPLEGQLVEQVLRWLLLQVSAPALDQLVPAVPRPDPVYLSLNPGIRLSPRPVRLPALLPPGQYSLVAPTPRLPRTNPRLLADLGPSKASLSLLHRSQRNKDHSLRPPGVKVTEALRAADYSRNTAGFNKT